MLSSKDIPKTSARLGLLSQTAELIPPFATSIAIATAIALLRPTPSAAFPPAPFHTIYGMVRDENGNALRVDGAQVVFYRGATEVLRQTIADSALLDQNYQIRLRMDMQRPNTASYTELSHSAGTAFSLKIIVNDIAYLPIEMSSPRTVGSPGERVRLDLTLGVDSDNDGIPDAWEQSQLYAGGIMPGSNGAWDLSLITRDGDFDGDGISNWNEYIAGTYATDPTDHLALQIIAPLGTHTQLRFFSIYGKTYSLESSTDLQTWGAATLYTSNPIPPPVDPDDYETPAFVAPVAQTSLRAENTALVDIYAASSGGARTFYRLKVR